MKMNIRTFASAYVAIGLIGATVVAVRLLDFDPRPCLDPGGAAIAKSLRDNPEDWTADRYYLTNTRLGLRIWRNDIEMAWIGFSTGACRGAMRRAAAPIIRRDRMRASESLAARVSAGARS